jgi:hypothetical protein
MLYSVTMHSYYVPIKTYLKKEVTENGGSEVLEAQRSIKFKKRNSQK